MPKKNALTYRCVPKSEVDLILSKNNIQADQAALTTRYEKLEVKDPADSADDASAQGDPAFLQEEPVLVTS